jgi:hypothetical protein
MDSMEFRNRRGALVDPVPFFVVAASVFVFVYSFGPVYLTALDLSLETALAVTTSVFLALTVVAYHRLVWTSRPEHIGILPPAARLKRLVYAIACGIGVLVLLSLPLVA